MFPASLEGSGARGLDCLGDHLGVRPVLRVARVLGGVVQLREVALGVEGGRATGAGGGDRLPVYMVDEIAGREA